MGSREAIAVQHPSSTNGASPSTNGSSGPPHANGRAGAERAVAASAVRAFVAWLTTRGETVHAGALEPSDRMFRATLDFLRERGLENEPYNPDWQNLLKDH